MKRNLLIILSCLIILPYTLTAQSALPDREVRAVWVATVYNLDWPLGTGFSEESKRNDLKSKLVSLKEAGINTVYFQVRTYGDAMYDSPYEPWSQYLTGEEGKAPNPYWDPLEFAVQEAHKLGIELHAWINPYRSMSSIPGDFTQKISTDEQSDAVDESLIPFRNRYFDEGQPKYKGTAAHDAKHASNTHPDWLLILKNASGVNDLAILDPGLPEVREYVSMIVADIVRRYDVDGIHFDDYFYPYPENGMKVSYNTALDDSSFNLNPRGFTDRHLWRRDNVNLFIEQVNDSIKAVKPWVKFGISPFGIYKNGLPFGTTGLSSYDEIYIDPLKWAQEGYVDYLMPQLYWKFGGGQDFQKLANWWAKEIFEKRGRHLYPGTAPYRADNATRGSSALFAANEIPRQIQLTRDNQNINGISFFRMKNITSFSTQGLRDSLITNYFRKPAIVPTMDWLDTTAPESPINLGYTQDSEQDNIITLNWERYDQDAVTKPQEIESTDSLLYYAVYRVEGQEEPDVNEVIANPENRIGLTGETEFTDVVESNSGGKLYYVLTSVSRNGVESEPVILDAGITVTPTEHEPQIARGFALEQNYPNPFNPATRITFRIGKSGYTTLKVFDILGREVADLVHANLAIGEYSVDFNASSLASGIYLYQLNSNGVTLSKRLTLIK